MLYSLVKPLPVRNIQAETNLQTYTLAYIQTDRQTHTDTGRHPGMQNDLPTYTHPSIHTYIHVDIYIHTYIHTDNNRETENPYTHTYIQSYTYRQTDIHRHT